MKYQVKNEFMEKIQISHGFVLNVLKYKRVGHYIFRSTFNKNNSKRVAPGVLQSKVEIVNEWCNITYPPGTYFIDGFPIELVDNSQYSYELKVAGGTISGNHDEIIETLNQVIEEVKGCRASKN